MLYDREKSQAVIIPEVIWQRLKIKNAFLDILRVKDLLIPIINSCSWIKQVNNCQYKGKNQIDIFFKESG